MDGNVWGGLMPKKETQALDFISMNPTFDGRGIIIGILDTGIDPGAIGLSTTSDGKPKLIDIIDCSGSGDVIMSAPVKCTHDGYLHNTGGKTLKINKSWKNPTGMYRIGIKRAYDFYPADLKTRLREDQRVEQEKEFRKIEGDLQKLLSDSKPGDVTDDTKLRIAALKAFEKEFDDPGPIYTCVVFHDGDNWQAAIDTSETGDFNTAIVMTDYRIHRQYSTFSTKDKLNYCVNIYDEGATLSIVVDASPHGTHVAGIAAAFFPDQPECNGIAPGAQIVSLKIGDSRLGSMETGAGLMRGLIEAVKRGCHIVNMSYGEATSWCNTGAFTKLTDELVKKHGIIFVASAGNNGPGVSTVGCPGGTTSSCIGVGAFVTHSLMTAAYSMLERTEETNYTWSSMGPTLDGELGVSIMAPGAAVTCVSQWTLNKKQLMNGTSMASPNACGCISLLLSAAKASGYEWTPVSIRRAVENGAKIVPQVHVLGQGNGLIQVQNAWDIFVKSYENKNRNINYVARFTHPSFVGGIYLRQAHESSTANTYQLAIEPEFPLRISNNTKCEFEMRLELKSTASWIQVPNVASLINAGASSKQILVHVDPRALSIGLHTEFINVFDFSQSSDLGPILKIPVTVIRPVTFIPGTAFYDLGILTFSPGERQRKFMVPPRGCTCVEVRIVDPRTPTRNDVNGADTSIGNDDEEIVIKSEEPDGVATSLPGPNRVATELAEQVDDGGRNIVLHGLQLFRGTPYRDHEQHVYKTLTPGGDHIVTWTVIEEVTLELVLGRTWGTLGDTSFKVEITFRGVTPVPDEIFISGGQRVSRIVRLFSHLTSTEINPTGRFEKWLSTLKPQTSKISPLGERDVLPDGRPVYQLVLEYEFEIADPYDVIPRFPGLQTILYESNFFGQFFMVFNWKKLLVGSGDAWPKYIKLQKGKYTIRMQVRHTSSTVLETIFDMPCLLERSLKNPINIIFYNSQTDAMTGSNDNKFMSRLLQIGSSASFFIREPSQDSLPKSGLPGDVLVGYVTYLKKIGNREIISDRLKPINKGYTVRYTISDTKPKAAAVATILPSANIAATEITLISPEKALEDAVKEAKIKHLRSLVGNEKAFNIVFELLNSEYSTDLQLYQCRTNHLEKIVWTEIVEHTKLQQERKIQNYLSISDEITSISKCLQLTELLIGASNNVIALIGKDSIALELGTNLDKDDPAAVSIRKEIEGKKSILCDAYHTKAKAYLQILSLHDRLMVLNSLSASKPVIIVNGNTEDHATSKLPEIEANSIEDSTEVLQSTDEDTEVTWKEVADLESVGVAQTASNSELIQILGKINRDDVIVNFNGTFKELMKWDDVGQEKYCLLVVGRHQINRLHGIALKKINDVLVASESKLSAYIRNILYQERSLCWEKLGLRLAMQVADRWKLLISRESYDAF